MDWLGSKPGLKYSALARLAYAAGTGAAGLEPTLRRFERLAEELEITGANEVIARWRTEGMTAGSAYACPRTSYEITPLFLKGKAMYNNWLEAERKKTRGSFEEEFLVDETTPAARSTIGRRSATHPPPNYCIDASDAGSSASVATKGWAVTVVVRHLLEGRQLSSQDVREYRCGHDVLRPRLRYPRAN